MSYLVVDFQGFFDDEKRFIVKELATGSPRTNKSDCEVYRYLFKPPFPKSALHPRTIQTNDYCSRYLHHLTWEQGDIEYKGLLYIARMRAEGFEKILTKVS